MEESVSPTEVKERALGELLAVSIGTAIPLEEKIVIEKPVAPALWVNLYTAFRNYYESYTDPTRVKQHDVKPWLDELYEIQALVSDIVNITYYVTDTVSLPRVLPYAKVKVAHTPEQMVFENTQRLHIAAAVNERELGVMSFKQKIRGENQVALMMTHHPLDLLSRYEFSDLKLLSSYTGGIRGPLEWLPKTLDNEAYHHLPFNLFILQVLGDGAVQLYAQKLTVRRALVDLSHLCQWKPTTTRDKIAQDIRRCEDKEIATLFKHMLAAKLL